MKKYAILVAGGKGLRMGHELPKQFIEIKGLPVLMHTIKQFKKAIDDIEIIVVLPKEQQNYWNELISKYKFECKHQVADGGKTRYHSVKSGLSYTQPENALIAIHDGVRPLVSPEVILKCFVTAQERGSAVPVLPMIDSIRHLTPDNSESVDRDKYVSVQTPQTFPAHIIHEAYRLPYTSLFTDDASVVEANGNIITLTEGNRENIKITTPFDLKLADILL
ncbi:MAG: 2-C-methyl-D-erythritol 4-phosphate cytidylyltransferase [Bacteroidales bacterium]